MAFADWGLLEVTYLICSVDVSQFDLYNRGDKYSIVVGGCHCTYIYWHCLFEF